jgi:membrane protease YdiL (CAAX protease family)
MMDDRTAGFLHILVTTVFVATWIVLAIVGFLGSRRMSAAAKRWWMPRWMILIALLFVFFATSLTVLSSRSWSSLGILIVLLPVVILISYLNIKFTKFCDKCGSTLYNYNWFQPMRFCSKCGAELDTFKSTGGDNFLE